MVATLSNVNSAAGAMNYYEKDGYYAKNDPEHRKGSFWHGLAAEELGLAGKTIDPDIFQHMLEGHVPDTEQRLGHAREGEWKHRPAYDLTLSAPKSLSVAALVLGDKRIFNAHDIAVRGTLNHVEQHMLETRIYDRETGTRPRIQTPHLVAATFRHEANRNLDPQLHTHCIIMNMTYDEDGKWRSVDRTSMNRGKWEIGAYYRNELAKEIKRLGYEIVNTRYGNMQSFEIEGFTRGQIVKWSTRSEEIKQYMKDHNWAEDRADLRQKAALLTRERKAEPDRVELHKHWKERALELELTDGHKMPSRSRQSEAKAEALETSRDHYQDIANEAVNFAVRDFEERHSTFLPQKLRTEALASRPGLTGYEEVVNAINDLRENGRLIDGEGRRGEPVFTTDHIVRVERDVLKRLDVSQGRSQSLVGYEAIQDHLKDTILNEGQQKAISLILGSEDKVVGIQGNAGSGKTLMLGELKAIADDHDKQVIGLAPTGSATRTLEAESDIPSATLQSFLTKHGDIAKGIATPASIEERQAQFRDTILVVDEASMIGSAQMRDLLRITERLNFNRLALIGDSKQLNAVDAGAPFRQMQYNGMDLARMTENMRQRDPHLLDTVKSLEQGEPIIALEKLHDKGHVIEVEPDTLQQRAAEEWLRLDDRENALIMAPFRWQRDEINTHIREELIDNAELSDHAIMIERLESFGMSKAQKQQAENYNGGDIVVFAVDSPRANLEAHEIYTVTHIEDKFVHLKDREGNAFDFDPRGGEKTRGDIASRLNVYEARDMEIREGDTLRWTRGNNERDIKNGDTVVVTSIKQEHLSIITDNGRKMLLSSDDPQLAHCNYAYASTVHAAQGRSTDTVVAVLGSDGGPAIDQKTFYVEVTRARDQAIILTDDREELSNTLAASPGEEFSALQALLDEPQEVSKQKTITQDHDISKNNMQPIQFTLPLEMDIASSSEIEVDRSNKLRNEHHVDEGHTTSVEEQSFDTGFQKDDDTEERIPMVGDVENSEKEQSPDAEFEKDDGMPENIPLAGEVENSEKEQSPDVELEKDEKTLDGEIELEL